MTWINAAIDTLLHVLPALAVFILVLGAVLAFAGVLWFILWGRP